jgi:hypothetical protein
MFASVCVNKSASETNEYFFPNYDFQFFLKHIFKKKKPRGTRERIYVIIIIIFFSNIDKYQSKYAFHSSNMIFLLFLFHLFLVILFSINYTYITHLRFAFTYLEKKNTHFFFLYTLRPKAACVSVCVCV